MQVERTFAVAAPVETVFAFLEDFRTTEAWDPGTRSTTRISGDGGLGTRYANRSEFMGREVELEYETVVHQPPHRVEFRGRNDGCVATDSLTLRAMTPERTEIHYRATFEFTKRWLRLVAPVVLRGRLGRLADETVEQMRGAIETPRH